VAQAAALVPLFAFCAAMWRWERACVVDSRFTGAADGRPEAAAAAAGEAARPAETAPAAEIP